MRIGLLGCVKKKKDEKAMAKDLYCSAYFIKGREYVERCYDRWFILSARHHLLDPNKVILPYNETLKEKNAEERKAWSAHVLEQIKEELKNPERYELFFHAGIEYRHYLVPLCEQAGYKWHIPLEGKRIGEQQKIYDEWNKKKSCLM